MNVVITEEASALVVFDELPLAQNPAAVYLAGLSTGSRRTAQGALNRMADMLTAGSADAFSCGWSALRFQHTAALRAQLMDRLAPSSVRLHISILRGVLKAAWRLGQISSEDYTRAVDLEPVRGKALPAGRMITGEEIASLLGVCANDPSPAGIRDAAMIALWVVTGLRRAEMVALTVEDYNTDTGSVTIMHGKGDKARVVYVSNGAKDALDDWIEIRGVETGALFVPVHQSGRVRIAKMSSQAAYNMLAKRAGESGIKDITPHDFRRTAISNLIEITDLATAQAVAGHDDPKTTSRYDRRGDEAKQVASTKLEVPYTRRELQ